MREVPGREVPEREVPEMVRALDCGAGLKKQPVGGETRSMPGSRTVNRQAFDKINREFCPFGGGL